MKYAKPQINNLGNALISVHADPYMKGPSGSDTHGSKVFTTTNAYQADE
jgi:hypothetical protein